jgi:phage terminase large subunit-like protein
LVASWARRRRAVLVSEALAVLNALVLEDGRRWREAAAEFQCDDARAILEPGPDDPRLHFVTRPRGGSKTCDNAGIAIAALLEQFGPTEQGYAVAADADQAALLIDAAGGFLQRTPELAGVLAVERRRIVTPNGAAVNVVPADGASAFGLRGPLFVVDEFAQWKSTPEPRRVWEAIFSAVPKVPGCRLVILTSAGDPAHWSHKVLEVARASSAWRVHEVPGPVPWIGEAELDEQRRILTESQYRRLHLNEWVAPEDRLTTVEDVRSCVRADPLIREYRRGQRYVLAADLGVKKDASVLAVCHLEGADEDPIVVLDRMEAFVPSRGKEVDLIEVEEAIAQLAFRYDADIVFDPWQAKLMARNLRERGWDVREFNFTQQSIGRLALNLYGLLRDQRLELPPDEALLDELANVRLRETAPGVFRIDHDADRHDDRAIALGLAALTLLDLPPKRRKMRYRGTETESFTPDGTVFAYRDSTGRLIAADPKR